MCRIALRIVFRVCLLDVVDERLLTIKGGDESLVVSNELPEDDPRAVISKLFI